MKQNKAIQILNSIVITFTISNCVNAEKRGTHITKTDTYRTTSANQCGRFPNCVKICETIYSRSKAKRYCKRLPPGSVERLDEMNEGFRNLNMSNVKGFIPEVFRTFVEIDPLPLKNYIKGFSPEHVKSFLSWMAKDPDIAETVARADRDYRLLRDLLRTLDPDIKRAFKTDLYPDEADSLSFMDIILREGNEKALELVHGFFEEKCAARSERELCIFQEWYCQVDLDESLWDNPEDYQAYREKYGKNLAYANFKRFNDIVKNILRDYKATGPLPEWWDEHTETFGLSEGWQILSLCNIHLIEKW